ncbi:MAG: PilZ domain-containing protein [Pseudomonadota bacterium]|nr:PilZ domain-containing protein [Pseudomonadota bacterium]
MSETREDHEPVEPQVQPEERRRSRRQRVLKSGIASFNDDFSTIPCVMRNVTEDGARLDFEALTPLPAHFMLHVGLDGFQIECQRVWTEGKACGVRFVGEKLPTRLFRTQKLGTSETALSEHALRAIELHERAEAEKVSEARPAVIETAPKRRPAGKPSFGRRN